MALDGALSHCQLPPSSLPEVGSVRVSMGEGNHNSQGPLEPQCGSLSPWLRHTCPSSRIRRSETLSFCLPALWLERTGMESSSPEPESWGPSWLLSLRLEGTGAKSITFLLLVMQKKAAKGCKAGAESFPGLLSVENCSKDLFLGRRGHFGTQQGCLLSSISLGRQGHREDPAEPLPASTIKPPLSDHFFELINM